MKELQLTDNPGYQAAESDKGDVYIDRQAARYICPITGLEMSGKYKYVLVEYFWYITATYIFVDIYLEERF